MVQALEFYSGIGGLHCALTRSHVPASVIRAFDWDQNACRIYGRNYGEGIVRRVDISTLTAADLGALDAELWLLSPACQPYTMLNPNAKGAADPRAKSFLHLVQTVLPELAPMQRPSHLLVENVAGFETSSTRQVLLATLARMEYSVREFLLTPLQFGIPNSRLRYYLLARREPWAGGVNETVLREIPGRVAGDIKMVRDYLDDDGEGYAVSDRVLTKWGRLFDIVLPGDRKTCCFTSGYTHLVERAGSILQMNEELDTTKTFDEFLQTADPAILRPLRLRYFTPSELLRISDFDPSLFQWPDEVSRKTKYRLIGNSVNVRVVASLVDHLFD
ncbi:S-adenosyl-L-methionine-dependent methyltransferase [Guyanagaster necrorhizus]|uniref:tRNA (cytosine(38)-C(5))-methyltransferase n=1 Tax=Guyanagaster necrorhizus TaxID=856835 RepID=A0A9P7W2J7_9AGAR|nr:S-adenosyl-L-methionine-dependent methyltransferase [Guyanagaster necrorhizus MCA 3950]KAG7450810.1 S-adenosyl-L-methionine-dependent methyltransferase [Guyanagaster necrorhizus MCA 3950]